ncbi:MAG: O-antigen ligase family protein [Bacteroidales bacterium]|nr:O-antigen ligase family protein [Bacteroidales bacterium]
MLVNSFLISQEVYWFSVLPAVLIILMVYIFALDKIYLLIAFFTPLAIDMSEIGIKANIGLSLPSEPLLLGLMFLFIVKLFFDKNFDRRIFTHPVSISIYFYLIWMFLTSLTSEYPLVSFKFFLARLWFIIPVYFFGIMVFKNFKNIPRFIWAYVLGLFIVIPWTISQHAINGFTDHAAHWVMSPFFNDHTSYGAVLAMFIPIIFGFAIAYYKKSTQKFFTALALIILLTAIYLSISRAAWASIIIAMGIFFLLRFRIRISWILSAAAIFLFFIFSFQGQIMMKMEKNKQDSSDDFVEHVKSMSNIATDASNLERINRWMSAIRMFKERPIQGWGPGTYQFVYAPFQSVEQKTVISTNVGNRGTAHSEYLLALAEQGIIGILSFVILLLLITRTAIHNYYDIADQKVRLLGLVLFLGLTTYFAHAVFNNFLDTDKMAVPFFGIIAAIVAIDIYHKEQIEDEVPD